MIQKAKFTNFIGLALFSAVLTGHPALAQLSPQQYAAVRDHVERGNGLFRRNMFEQAMAEYTKCLEIDPKNAVARDNLALAHNQWGVNFFKQKKYEEADRQFEEALKISPNQVNAKKNLQILQAELNRLGLELVDEAPPAPAQPPGDDAANPADPAAPPAQGAPGPPTKPGAAPPAAAGKTPQGKFMLNAGVKSGEDTAEPPAAKAPSLQAPASAKKPPAGDEFDDATEPPAPAATAAAAKKGGQAQTTAGGRVTNYPRGYEQDPSVGPGANPEGATAVPGVRVLSSPNFQTQPAAQSQPTAAQPAAQSQPVQIAPGADAGATPAAAPTGSPDDAQASSAVRIIQTPTAAPAEQTLSAPQIPQPDEGQVYEDKAAGTSIRIMPRAPEATPPAVQPPPPPPPPAAPEIVPHTAPPPVAEPAPTAQPASTSASDGMTIEDQLTKLEMKVYGRKPKAAPIFKRLEKLEVDSTGSVHVGTVQERIDSLRHQYGI